MGKQEKTKLVKMISEQCRRPKHCQDAFLRWVNSDSKFRRRKPTVEEVIKESRRSGSPLRVIMEQDTAKAASRYWRSEAQYYLRHLMVVRVEVATQEIVTKPIRAYIPISRNRDGTISEENYIPAQRVADNPSMQCTILERAHADFQAWIARYERYAEFFEAFSPVIQAYKSIRKKSKKSA